MPSSSKLEKLFANLFLLSVAVYLTLILSEVLMRCFFFHPTYMFQAAGMLNGHGHDLKVELIPDNLYEIQPNKQMGINSFGFRDHEFTTDKQGMKRICFLGDSFTMGLNVKAEETIPKQLEVQLHNYQVYNMGVVGFGPDQELNVLNKYGFGFKPDIVIDAICAQNDSNDIYKDGIYEVGEKGKLNITKSNPVKALVFPSYFALINEINFIKNRVNIVNVLDPLLFGDSYDLVWMKYFDSDESKFKFSLMRTILKNMHDEVAQKNIGFLAVIIPSYSNICDDKFFRENNVNANKYFANEEIYQYIFQSEKIPFVNLAPFFLQLNKEQRCALYDADNGHLSPAGDMLAAQAISHYLASSGMVKK